MPSPQYDSAEAFFADHVAMMTDSPGCTLRQGETTLLGGRGLEPLSIAALRAGSYEGGGDATKDDRLCLGSKRYRSDYWEFSERRPDLRNRIYGRVKRDRHGRAWLQYWFFYVYNDRQLVGRFGMHEGDWELVQFRLDETKDPIEPDCAVYAQHSYAEMRDWSDVLKADGAPDTPLVYVARGSHASYFEPGLYQTEALFDLADGQRGAPGSLELEVVEGDGPPWVSWPGVWGGTRARIEKIESDSPAGPHDRALWRDPAHGLEMASGRPRDARRLDDADLDAASAPLDARRLGRRLVVEFQQPEAGGGAWLVVVVNPPRRKHERQRTFTFDVRGRRRGTYVVEYAALEPDVEYEVGLTVNDGAARPLARRRVAVEAEDPGRLHKAAGELRLVAFFLSDRLRRLVRGLFGHR